VKTTIDLPEDLLRRAKAEAALRGRKLRELVAEGLAMRLAVHDGGKTLGGAQRPLVRNFRELPLIRAKPGAPKLQVTPQRIHALEMEAELERHAASLR
jgi:hypothetical protein